MLSEIIGRLSRGEKGDDLPILVSDLGVDYEWAAQKIFENHHGDVIAKILGGVVSVIEGDCCVVHFPADCELSIVKDSLVSISALLPSKKFIAVPQDYDFAQADAAMMRAAGWLPLGNSRADALIEFVETLIQDGVISSCFEMEGGYHVTFDPAGGESVAVREANSFRDGLEKLAAIAREVGFAEVSFQFEPLGAAYE